MSMTDTWKIGALAEAAGVTVRALHHYDHIGLLSPSERSSAGHRIYTEVDVQRLYRISLLRRLGFPLDEISDALNDPRWQLNRAVNRHLDDTRRRAAIAARLTAHLSEISALVNAHQQPSASQLFDALEGMTMLDNTIRGTTGLLVYEDIEAAQNYLVQVFGLTGGQLERDGQGEVVHGEVRAGDQVIWLHPPATSYRSPRQLGGATSMTVINVDDCDAHYAHAVEAGADIIEQPVDQVYGVREYGAQDPEGQLWYFHSPLA